MPNPEMDEKGRRILTVETVERVMDDALTADDIVFSPLGTGYLGGRLQTVAEELAGDRAFGTALMALSLEHGAAFYAYVRSLLAFGYQLARDDRGERP